MTSVESTEGSTATDSLATVTSKEPEERERIRRFSNASSIYSPGVLDYAGADPDDEEGGELKNDSSSVIKFYPAWCHCFQCLSRKSPYRKDESWKETIKTALLCPPQGPVARLLTFLLSFTACWGFVWLLLLEIGPDEKHHTKTPAGPGGPIFGLVILELSGLFAGICMRCLGLPALLGPLVLGIFLRNLEPINVFNNFKNWEHRNCKEHDLKCEHEAQKSSGHWIKPIREIALTMILTRAGLELSPKQLTKLKSVVPLLAFTPCVVEACACAGFTYVFFNVLDTDKNPISVYMCFVSGFALAAVSPAVVVPGMLSLKKRNYGVGQGVPTLLIAASSIDDVLAISLYTIFMGLALSAGSGKEVTTFEYASGFLGIIIGIVHGFIVGVFLHFIPAKDNRNKGETRLLLLLLFNLISMFAYEQSEGLAGAGSLAVLVTAFIASFGWRSQPHWKRPMKTIEHTLSILWILCVPLLFGTIGREIDLIKLFGDMARLGKILGIIFICLFIRCCTAFLVVGVIRLSFKERLFCALAWVPKATVQAALAPLVVSKIQELATGEKLLPHGNIVVITAVLAILITAPLGSVLIAFFGPRLLRVATIPERIHLEEEFPNGDGMEPDEQRDLQRTWSGMRKSMTLGSSQSVNLIRPAHDEDIKKTMSADAFVQTSESKNSESTKSAKRGK